MHSKGYPFSPSNEKDKCRTLIYAPVNNITNAIISNLAKNCDLTVGTDITGYGIEIGRT